MATFHGGQHQFNIGTVKNNTYHGSYTKSKTYSSTYNDNRSTYNTYNKDACMVCFAAPSTSLRTD